MAIATLRGLSYWYPGDGPPALDATSWELESGLTLVAGDSGSGKSTLLRVLNGLVPHFHGGRISGRAEVMGMDVLTTPTRTLARSVGFVFQDPERQFVHGSVRREIAFGLENIGTPAAAMEDRIDGALAAAGISSLAGRRVATLSGGERQRVAIASALALAPRLLVLDEPCAQLDSDGAAAVLAACRNLARSGHDVVLAEHRLEFVTGAATAAFRVVDGRVDPVDQARLTQPPEGRAAPPAGTGECAWELSSVSAGPADIAVLERVDLMARAGEVLVLRGPNGGGKTTLLRVIAGLLKPLAGTVERRPGRVAYLPQNPDAVLHLASVRAEVELTLRRGRDPESAGSVLRAHRLEAVAGRYPRDLSSGQRQRVALAAILAGSPAVALLDEPTRGMDGRAREALVESIERLASRGCSIVLATHDDALAARVAHRTVTVTGGRVS